MRVPSGSWFVRTFVLTMERLVTPIYEWTFELMRDDLLRAERISASDENRRRHSMG